MSRDARYHAAARARDAFLRAAAALTEPLTDQTLAFALLEGAIGLAACAEADAANEPARQLVFGYLRHLRPEAT